MGRITAYQVLKYCGTFNRKYWHARIFNTPKVNPTLSRNLTFFGISWTSRIWSRTRLFALPVMALRQRPCNFFACNFNAFCTCCVEELEFIIHLSTMDTVHTKDIDTADPTVDKMLVNQRCCCRRRCSIEKWTTTSFHSLVFCFVCCLFMLSLWKVG